MSEQAEETSTHRPPPPVCSKCGRPLKDPVSIEHGMGAVCRGDRPRRKKRS